MPSPNPWYATFKHIFNCLLGNQSNLLDTQGASSKVNSVIGPLGGCSSSKFLKDTNEDGGHPHLFRIWRWRWR